MISGIHLATALSVMLHMEQEGDGMDTKELIEALTEPCRDYSGEMIVRNSTPRNEIHCALLSDAAERLFGQKKVIDVLVASLTELWEFAKPIAGDVPDDGQSADEMRMMTRAVTALSHAEDFQ